MPCSRYKHLSWHKGINQYILQCKYSGKQIYKAFATEAAGGRCSVPDSEDKEFRGKVAPELQAWIDEVVFLHGRIMASGQSEVDRSAWR
jgi:hypothetical protein